MVIVDPHTIARTEGFRRVANARIVPLESGQCHKFVRNGRGLAESRGRQLFFPAYWQRQRIMPAFLLANLSHRIDFSSPHACGLVREQSRGPTPRKAEEPRGFLAISALRRFTSVTVPLA